MKPLGDLCVTHEPVSDRWAVVICTGTGVHQPIKWCATRAEAADFAAEEQARRKAALGVDTTVHFPDDCPCYCNFSQPV